MILVVVIFAKALQLVLKRFFKTSEPAKYLYGLVFVNVVTFAFLMLSVAIYGWGQQTYLLWIPLALAMAYPRTALNDLCQPKIVPHTSEVRSQLGELVSS